MNSLVFCVIFLLISCSGLQLPSSFKKCDRRRSDFNRCLSKAVYKAVKVLDKPLKLYGLPSLHDVAFPPDFFSEFGNSTYGLRQKYTNYRLIGLTKPQNIVARLDFGPLTSTLIIEATYPKLDWEVELEAQGTLVLLPLNVKTPLDFTFENPTFTFTFELEEYEKGATYFRVIDSGLDMQAHGIKFDFKHLFSNRHLNKEFNSEMSAKGRQICILFKS
ncbi:hypothetical protein Zmor_018815 [Zophobas morio]|uniref:Uncharacterized protein n=1 Tax=Zophobas morio TaxID=2755281 RepID=A0AA38IF41_9CUCU|nr:hypothetical protein Zmor_018815 [Zophobas morio]